MFFKKNEKWEKFNYTYRQLPADFQAIFMIWVTLYDVLKLTIQDRIFSKLQNFVKITNETKRITYHIISSVLDTSDLAKRNLLIDINDDIFYSAISSSLIASTVKDLFEMKEKMISFDVDNNLDIAFTQMMAKIFALDGKEFINSEKYNDIYNEFIAICKLFISGTLKGFSRVDPKLVHKKMFDIICNMTDLEITMFTVPVAMVLAAKNEAQH